MDNCGFTCPDSAMDLDFMEGLVFGGCWVETIDQYNTNPSNSLSLNSPLNYFPPLDPNTSHSILDPYQNFYQEETDKLNLQENPPSLLYPQIIQTLSSSGQPENFLTEGNELSKALWIAPSPRVDSGPSSSSHVQRKLMLAINKLKESTKDRNILIQIWVPVRREGKNVLTTTNQPYSLDPNCKSLECYRNVSENYQFPAEEDSKESVGLPGRVFLGKEPEWTPDVRLFKSAEYPRKGYAQQYNVQGSIALPIFERGSRTCLGVVEIVTTTQKMNYRPELENVCKALEAVDLRSSEMVSPGNIKACDELYKAALPEILDVLAFVCRTHRLPLAQTWAACMQHGKRGYWYSCKNYGNCVSTIDSAFYAANPQILGFHEACSEHHLFRGQGVVGKAFTTNEACFASDIKVHTKTEYPLSHHARMFDLRAAVAVRLLSVHTGSSEFVFEFFLPSECVSIEDQKLMLTSLSLSLQQAGRSLRTLTGKELGANVLLPVVDANVVVVASSNVGQETLDYNSSWVSNMMVDLKKGKGVAVSVEYQKEEPQEEFFKMTSESRHRQVVHDFGALKKQDSESKLIIGGSGGETSSFLSARSSLGGRKAGEKRRTKTEKTISLQVLRQYFAGSLKDAAKSIGVCPTTLKRICRQHGITRWPSRKIKKVGHSLRKLQLVINSVQGAEGALQIGNFYTNYPELSSPNTTTSEASPLIFSSSLKTAADQSNLQLQQEGGGGGGAVLFSSTSSKSGSSSCSQSSNSSLCCSTGANQQQPPSAMVKSLLAQDHGVGALKRTRSDAELHVPKLEETTKLLLPRSQSHKFVGMHAPNLEIFHPLNKNIKRGTSKEHENGFRVKVAFGEEKIRFSLQHNWVFRDLQQEIATRFSMLDDISRMDLKYLDDDCEWVLLTCDADLEECIDIYKSCQRHTIKLLVHLAACNQNLGGSFGSSGLC